MNQDNLKALASGAFGAGKAALAFAKNKIEEVNQYIEAEMAKLKKAQEASAAEVAAAQEGLRKQGAALADRERAVKETEAALKEKVNLYDKYVAEFAEQQLAVARGQEALQAGKAELAAKQKKLIETLAA